MVLMSGKPLFLWYIYLSVVLLFSSDMAVFSSATDLSGLLREYVRSRE